MAGSHGSSPAAWTAVAVFLVGFTISCIGMVLGPNWVLFCIGAVFIPISGIVGKVMSAAGLGADPAAH